MKRGLLMVLLPVNRGFCFGVRRAVRGAEDRLKRGGGCTLGPLIHNRSVVEDLQKKGLRPLKSIEDIPAGGAFLIRSHGILEEDLEHVRKRGAEIVDLTCPFVKRARDFAVSESRKGRLVLIAGDPSHPEVKGIASFLRGRCRIITTPEEVELVETRGEGVSLLSQTTFIKSTFEAIRGKCIERFGKVEVLHSICDSTSIRQEEAGRFAGVVDILIVVGGKNSANTTNLFEIGRRTLKRVYHVEGAGELDLSLFRDKDTVGIIGGASTPEGALLEVIHLLKKGFDVEVSRLPEG